MDWFEVAVVAFWAVLPAYVPNNFAVLAGGGQPIDGGRTWHGRRILGDGKTWRGTAVGIAAGVLLALALNALRPTATELLDFPFPEFPLHAALALAAGAMLGDILASFLKRRTGRQRGAAFPGLDQYDFLVVSLALTALVAPAWFGATFTLRAIAVLLVLTPVLHLLTNVIAHALGLKNEPW